MGLIKIRLGDYIEQSTENNSDLRYGNRLIVGVTSDGVFAPPKVDTSNVELKPYKVVNNGAFVYNPTRLDLGSIAYRTEGLCIVSHLYMVFYLTEAGKRLIDPVYLHMYFRRSEFRREVTFRNFGSQRPEFNFKKMSDIVIPLPPIEVQRKYVLVYNAMLRNQEACSKELNGLKIICAASIDKCKAKFSTKPVGALLEEVDVRNKQNQCDIAYGVNIEKRFIESALTSADISNYKIVNKGQFVYSSMQTGRDKSVRLTLYNGNNPIAVSPAYSVLQLKTDSVLAEYIQLWFLRSETDRRGWFMSDGSVRANLDLPRLYEIEVPIPDMEVQRSIVDFYNAYNKLQKISEKVQERIQSICPVLIRGAIQEGANG